MDLKRIWRGQKDGFEKGFEEDLKGSNWI